MTDTKQGTRIEVASMMALSQIINALVSATARVQWDEISQYDVDRVKRCGAMLDETLNGEPIEATESALSSSEVREGE